MNIREIPQVQSLTQGIEWDREHLARLLREYRAERGLIMRPYRRDLCRQAIKHIRIAQANLATWGEVA